MAANPPARRKPTRKTKPDVDRAHLIDTFFAVGQRLAGVEARVKAEARIANERLARLEARLDRIAAALHRLIAARDENPSDSENE